MHVPVGHSFPVANGVAFALGLGPPSLLAAIFINFFLSTIRAFLGGLTWSKTLENLHTHWNPRQLGRR